MYFQPRVFGRTRPIPAAVQPLQRKQRPDKQQSLLQGLLHSTELSEQNFPVSMKNISYISANDVWGERKSHDRKLEIADEHSI